jgi:hypothetical protein
MATNKMTKRRWENPESDRASGRPLCRNRSPRFARYVPGLTADGDKLMPFQVKADDTARLALDPCQIE